MDLPNISVVDTVIYELIPKIECKSYRRYDNVIEAMPC